MKLHTRPLFIFAAAYILGIISATFLHAGPLLGVGFGIGLYILLLLLPSRIMHRWVAAIIACVFVIGFVHTFVWMSVPSGDVSEYAKGKMVTVVGRVVSDPQVNNDRISFILSNSGIKTYVGEYPVSGRTMMSVYVPRYLHETPRIPCYGETVRVHGRLSKPLPPSNAGSSNYKQYLARQRVFSTLSATCRDIVTVDPPRWSVTGIAMSFKSALSLRTSELFSHMHSELLLGILLGEYAGLPIDIQNMFMRSGTMHLLAASGYNCGIVVGIFGCLMYRLTAPRTWRHTLLIILLWMFALVAGGGPSIIRASIMTSAFLAAYLLMRASDTLNIILFSAMIILGVNPLFLYDVGFQLSFAAVIAVILITPILDVHTGHWFVAESGNDTSVLGRGVLWCARIITGSVIISVVASLATWPITAYYFNYVSVVAIIANAFTAILVLMLTGFGIAALVIAAVLPSIGHIASLPAEWCMVSMLSIVGGLSEITWSLISIPAPPVWFILVYYSACIGVLEYVYRKYGAQSNMVGANYSRNSARSHSITNSASSSTTAK